jgi:putative transposase
MPRHARLRIEGLPLHITHRGNNKADCFFQQEDHLSYLRLLAEHAEEHDCAVHAYVLMTNHVHLLLTPERADGVSHLMKDVAQRYTQRINKVRERTGSLWEGRFKSCIVDSESYLLRCQRYIEMNPVRAGLVAHPADYPWSSFRTNAYGAPSEVVRPHPLYEALGTVERDRLIAYQSLFIGRLPEADLQAIRLATRGGFALGDAAFADRLSVELGVRTARAR